MEKEEEKLNNYKKNRLSLVNDFNDIEDNDVENDINNMDATSFMDVLNNIPESEISENQLKIQTDNNIVSELVSTDKSNNEDNNEDNNSAINSLNLLISNLNNPEKQNSIQTSEIKTKSNSDIQNNTGMPYIYINNSSNITIQFSK